MKTVQLFFKLEIRVEFLISELKIITNNHCQLDVSKQTNRSLGSQLRRKKFDGKIKIWMKVQELFCNLTFILFALPSN